MERKRGFAIVRGGGVIATGVIYRLLHAEFKDLCLETELPHAIRRSVSEAQAKFDGSCSVEGITLKRITSHQDVDKSCDTIEILVDPNVTSIIGMHPDVLVDAVIAKKPRDKY